MIGFYNYTVILTYISLAISMFGIAHVIEGNFRTAIMCLALSGLCDMFDGKIARHKKDRTFDEKLFGLQIDSLCDVVCFGAFPAIFCYYLGVRGPIGFLATAFYAICAVIRLGFFNVLETNRQATEDGSNKFYYGLPVTSISIILPLAYLLNFVVEEEVFRWILFVLSILVGILFILNFKLKKPSNIALTFLVIIGGIATLIIVVFSKKYHVELPGFFERSLFSFFTGEH